MGAEKEILELEKNFVNIEYMSNEKYLKSTIHDSFLEVGKSGQLFNKSDAICCLLKCTENKKIEIRNYVCKKIDLNTYLVHYETINEGKKYFRTSIWIKEKNLKILFHQVTELIN